MYVCLYSCVYTVSKSVQTANSDYCVFACILSATTSPAFMPKPGEMAKLLKEMVNTQDKRPSVFSWMNHARAECRSPASDAVGGK